MQGKSRWERGLVFPEVWVGVGQETCQSIREGGGVDFLNNPIVYFVVMYKHLRV